MEELLLVLTQKEVLGSHSLDLIHRSCDLIGQESFLVSSLRYSYVLFYMWDLVLHTYLLRRRLIFFTAVDKSKIVFLFSRGLSKNCCLDYGKRSDF